MPRIRRGSDTGYSSPSRYQTNHESESPTRTICAWNRKRNKAPNGAPVYSTQLALVDTPGRSVNNLEPVDIQECADIVKAIRRSEG